LLQKESFKINGESVRKCKKVALLKVEEEKERRYNWRIGIASCKRKKLIIYIITSNKDIKQVNICFQK